MAAGGGTQKFIFAREGTFGTKQASGTYDTFRASRGSVRNAVRTVESQLIRGDRQGAGTQPAFFASEGSLQTELICNDVAHDELIARGLYSSFVNADLTDAGGTTKGNTKTETGVTIAAAGSNVFNLTGAESLVTNLLQPGCWFGVNNLSAAADGWWRVVTVDDLDSITVEANGIGFDGVVKAHPGVVPGDADESYSFRFARNFTQKIGLTVERGFTDVDEYLFGTGMVVSQFNLNLASEQLSTGSFTLLGTGYGTAGATADASPTAAGTNVPLAASTDVSRIYKGGATLASVRRVEFALDNRVTQLSEIGTSTAADVIAGTYAITGTLEAYFNTRTVLEDLVQSQAAFSVETTFVDPSGNLFSVALPAVNLTGGGVDESGSDDAVVGTYPFGGRLASGGDYLMQVDSITKPA